MPLMPLLLAASAAVAGPVTSPASIDGTVSVAILSPTIKHWGVPEAEAAFVPDDDTSAVARTIRAAGDALALCAALERAAGTDAAISLARADGDGDLEHRSGDEARLVFRIAVPAGSLTSGRIYVCSHSAVAIVSRGMYPNERFERTGGHAVSWIGRRIALRPGEHVRVALSTSVDASEW